MGNICSDSSSEKPEIKSRGLVITETTTETTKTMQETTEDPKVNLYNTYSKVYKDYDYYTAKELFEDTYEKVCRLIDIYDGDTCKVSLQLFENQIYRFSVRLAGIDTPELRTRNEEEKKAGLAARNLLLMSIANDNAAVFNKKQLDIDEISSKEIKTLLSSDIYLVRIETQGFDKYGRLLVKIYPFYDTEKKSSYNDQLVELGHAYSYDGGTKQTFGQ
jgi:Kyanoviridae endonuclease